MGNKKLFCIAAAFLASFSVFALEVDRAELESANGNNVVFQNYSGPHAFINTADQIRQIGSNLGDSVVTRIDSYGTVGTESRYYVIHAVDPAETGKLDADIFIIGADSMVDHISNVRRIISGYLVSTYKYSRADADTVATYVTVYNAVYRGKTDYFAGKYKKVVLDKISTDKVGISTSYEDWAGKTQIVIPLSDVHGGLSSVDTSIISDKNVRESLQSEEDKGIDVRKEMVDIKEREAENAAEKAQESQKQASEEKSKLAEEQEKARDANKEASDAKKDANTAQKEAENAQKEAENAQKQAENAQKEADEAQKKADANPNDKQAQEDAAKKQQAADEKKAEAENKQQAADEKKAEAENKQQAAEDAQSKADKQAESVNEQAQKTQEAQDKATEEQAKADKKLNEAQEERAEIAKDQQQLIKEASEVDGDSIIFGLKTVDELGVLSEIVKMDASSGKTVKESPVAVIRSRTVYEEENNFVAIAGTNIGNGAIKLVLIDKNTLEITKESSEVLSETSVLIEYEGNYYAVVKSGNGYAIGKFNSQTELQLKSPVAVKPATAITITSKGILATADNGSPIVLRLNDLTAIAGGSAPAPASSTVD
ncbi:P83/100 family protein, partial [Treponema zioleckii]|uniref:P83/100 family protein n=1 Tax=Treponema zioleckii TaxID=331680 RepID=UPI00168B2DF0